MDERSKGFEPDRFLFVSDGKIRRICCIEVFLEKIILKHLPRQKKKHPFLDHFAKVDVWADDAEVQGTNTKNLPKEKDNYIIDAKLLKPIERDFNKMNDIYIILIAPFDLFGKRKYMYTFEMTCKEDPSVSLEDGKNMENDEKRSWHAEHTTQDMADGCKSERIHKMQKRICSIKSSEEVSVRYMQRWEEMEMEKEAARELGLAEGRTQGLTEGRACGGRASRGKKFYGTIDR